MTGVRILITMADILAFPYDASRPLRLQLESHHQDRDKPVPYRELSFMQHQPYKNFEILTGTKRKLNSI